MMFLMAMMMETIGTIIEVIMIITSQTYFFWGDKESFSQTFELSFIGF